MNPSVNEQMRKWLKQNGNRDRLGISPELAAPFNAEFQQSCPKLYAVAAEHVRLCRRREWQYSPEHPVYTYVDYMDINSYPIPGIDPYPQTPDKAVLLADTAFLLAACYPALSE